MHLLGSCLLSCFSETRWEGLNVLELVPRLSLGLIPAFTHSADIPVSIGLPGMGPLQRRQQRTQGAIPWFPQACMLLVDAEQLLRRPASLAETGFCGSPGSSSLLPTGIHAHTSGASFPWRVRSPCSPEARRVSASASPACQGLALRAPGAQ